MRKVTKKVLALVMMMALAISSVPTTAVYAMDNDTKSVVAKEGRLNYIYVDHPYVKTPGTQKIVVSWGDGTEAIRNMRITVEREDGSREEWKCNHQAEQMYLFAKEYEKDTEESTYQVVDIKFEENGIEQQFVLEELGAEAEFGVNKEYDGIDELKPLDPEYAENINKVETSVITIDENGIMEENNATVGARTAERSGQIVVALDPGHDNRHGGAAANGLIEQDLTLKIANYTKKELEEYGGVKVYMTRTTAECPYPTTGTSGECIEQRAKAAAAEGAKIFVSFHLNSSEATGVSGAEIIIPNQNWKPQVGTDGKALAEKIITELAAVGVKKRPTPIYSKDSTISSEKYPDGSKSDYYSVQIYNKENGIPGIIIEHAFISNQSDVNNFLKSEAGLKKLGVADATGIAKYLGVSKGTWEFVSGKGWRYKTAGQYVSQKWEFIGDAWYYFNADAYMCTGWFKWNNRYYYLGQDGAMRTGWQFVNEKWYYFNTSGIMQTGWQYLGEKWYYLNADGAMQTGWQKISNQKYYFNSSGVMQKGWLTLENSKYYLNASGAVVYGWQTIEGERYYFDEETGKLTERHTPGWVSINGKWYYYNTQGYKTIGWQYIGTKWYYFNDTGVMQTGWQFVNNEWYYLNSSGAMQTGWQYLSKKWYYLKGSGVMQRGWLELSGKKYYMNASGAMQVGWQFVDDKWYYLNSDGVMQTGWRYLNSKWYYMDTTGIMQTGLLTIGGKHYYMNASGVMQTGWQYIGDKWYYFDGSGAALIGWHTISGKKYYFNEAGIWMEHGPVEGKYLIEGKSAVSISQMCRYFKNSGKVYPSEKLGKGGAPDIETFCKLYEEEARAEGIAAEVAFVQTMKETGWLQFGGTIKIEQFNFAGLGATDDGAQGADFSGYGKNGVRMGVRAQIQHLKAYASSTITEQTLKNQCVDPRFKYVKKGSAKYVEWLGQHENPTGDGWATSKGYGEAIVKMIRELKTMNSQ